MKLMHLTLITVLISFANTALAGQFEINWQNVEHYSDVKRTGITPQESYNNFIIKELSEEIIYLTEQLPSEQTLVVNITDVNLAGWVDPRLMPERVRVVVDHKPAQITLNYQLVEADKIIKQGNVELDDRGFSPTRTAGNETLYYEKELIQKWFRQTFA
ncbi:DUF3016 domain-containing protein [Catenovulum sp. SM1970]|uniref:DUF3016 domain-containing protein n=1 Tax=Marinifaba aquimaris TaxID=2741323 RepID=UPI00157172C0|nr:DUF3016 domain-containing protein [Marinifaba aquimaris]NTS77801.1 DUF3016 domain-containing protein [Marinifaba aquimaris]